MKTITINSKKYEIAEADYPESLTFSEAENKLDNNWILPHFDLLLEMYNNRGDLGGFDSKSNYWSSERYCSYGAEFDQRDEFIYVIYCGSGKEQTLPDERYKCKCRFVKEVI